MTKHVLVLNSGSSSVKFAVVDPQTGRRLASGLAERLGGAEARLQVRVGQQQRTMPLTKGENSTTPDRGLPVEAGGTANHQSAVASILRVLSEENLSNRIMAVGHRVVHGGEHFSRATLVDDGSVDRIRQVSGLAPLHNPVNLLCIDAARLHFSNLPHVAVFDTAFHQSMPESAYRYAVPDSWYRKHGVRKYGFHGTSHQFVAREAAMLLDRPLERLQLLTAHLGNGCSATAVRHGESVDTTMGMTPLSGLVMGTRSGDLDPGAVLFMLERLPGGVEEVSEALNRESGLLGLSGTSNDVRTLIEAEKNGDSRARLALDVFCRRVASSLLGLSAALSGMDALVFTGGIGENASTIRKRIVERLWPLGLELDPSRNDSPGSATRETISSEQSLPVFVIATDEEWMIARATQELL